MTVETEWDVEAQAGAAGVAGFWRRVRSGDTFGFLFVLLLLNFTVCVAAGQNTAGRIMVGVLSGATPLVALMAAKAPRRYIVAAIGLFVLAFTASIVDVALTGDASSALSTALLAALLFACVPITLLRLFEHETVTGETVAGSLCVYLLIGMAFASLYMAIGLVGDPVISGTAPTVGAIDRGDYFYFSFISMLTVGFGDIVPVGRAGQALVVLQAITGQIVLLTLVARMVTSATPRRKPVRRLAKREEQLERKEPGEGS